MTNPPPVTPDDAADTLAKECITRFCTATSKFMQHRVMQSHMANPMEGFRLPYQPLAAKIREVATQMGVTVAPPPSNDWFSDAAPEATTGNQPAATSEQKALKTFSPPPPPAPTEPQQGVGCEFEDGSQSVSLEGILRIVETRKVRLNQLAGELGVSPDVLGQVISRPASGLIVANGGWVQLKA
jgi:hypothetical protein